MSNLGKYLLGFLGVLIVLVVLDFGFGYIGVLKKRTVGKEKQDAEREVFEETKSYQEGMAQQLNRYRMQYMKAKDEDEKEAIRFTVTHQFADYPEENLQLDLLEFLHAMQSGEVYP